MDLTIVSYYGKQTSRCGYCKGTECSIAHGMHAYKMAPFDYQDLIDRGWRRSGHYCYKPNNQTTCCPCYTIKCDTSNFKLSKSHKKILKRMNRFLRDGKKDKSEEEAAVAAATAASCSVKDNDEGRHSRDEAPKAPNIPIRDIDVQAVVAANPGKQFVTNDGDDKRQTQTSLKSDGIPIVDTNFVAPSDSLVGSKKSYDESKPPCKKAKQMRLERRQAKLAAKGIDEASVKSTSTNANAAANQEKSLKDFFAATSSSDRHKLKLKLVHVGSKHFFNTLGKTYGLYEKYQTLIHSDPPEGLEEYLQFLQKSPLKHMKTHDGPPTGYGSFHQQYWLDDKLIAVGVIDILPYCVSSVYFFYDPDYSFLSLGTYGSLREIEFVQQLAEKVPSLKNYYMGFYIHSCPKMRYKGKLASSYLLCPETYTWNLLTDEIRNDLNHQKYKRLNNDPEEQDVDDFQENHLDLVSLLIENNTCITYREYIQSFNIETIDNMLDMIRSRLYKEITGDSDVRESILEYGKLVGKTCAHRMLYVKM